MGEKENLGTSDGAKEEIAKEQQEPELEREENEVSVEGLGGSVEDAGTSPATTVDSNGLSESNHVEVDGDVVDPSSFSGTIESSPMSFVTHSNDSMNEKSNANGVTTTNPVLDPEDTSAKDGETLENVVKEDIDSLKDGTEISVVPSLSLEGKEIGINDDDLENEKAVEKLEVPSIQEAATHKEEDLPIEQESTIALEETLMRQFNEPGSSSQEVEAPEANTLVHDSPPAVEIMPQVSEFSQQKSPSLEEAKLAENGEEANSPPLTELLSKEEERAMSSNVEDVNLSERVEGQPSFSDEETIKPERQDVESTLRPTEEEQGVLSKEIVSDPMEQQQPLLSDGEVNGPALKNENHETPQTVDLMPNIVDKQEEDSSCLNEIANDEERESALSTAALSEEQETGTSSENVPIAVEPTKQGQKQFLPSDEEPVNPVGKTDDELSTEKPQEPITLQQEDSSSSWVEKVNPESKNSEESTPIVAVVLDADNLTSSPDETAAEGTRQEQLSALQGGTVVVTHEEVESPEVTTGGSLEQEPAIPYEVVAMEQVATNKPENVPIEQESSIALEDTLTKPINEPGSSSQEVEVEAQETMVDESPPAVEIMPQVSDLEFSQQKSPSLEEAKLAENGEEENSPPLTGQFSKEEEPAISSNVEDVNLSERVEEQRPFSDEEAIKPERQDVESTLRPTEEEQGDASKETLSNPTEQQLPVLSNGEVKGTAAKNEDQEAPQIVDLMPYIVDKQEEDLSCLNETATDEERKSALSTAGLSEEQENGTSSEDVPIAAEPTKQGQNQFLSSDEEPVNPVGKTDDELSTEKPQEPTTLQQEDSSSSWVEKVNPESMNSEEATPIVAVMLDVDNLTSSPDETAAEVTRQEHLSALEGGSVFVTHEEVESPEVTTESSLEQEPAIPSVVTPMELTEEVGKQPGKAQEEESLDLEQADPKISHEESLAKSLKEQQKQQKEASSRGDENVRAELASGQESNPMIDVVGNVVDKMASSWQQEPALSSKEVHMELKKSIEEQSPFSDEQVVNPAEKQPTEEECKLFSTEANVDPAKQQSKTPLSSPLDESLAGNNHVQDTQSTEGSKTIGLVASLEATQVDLTQEADKSMSSSAAELLKTTATSDEKVQASLEPVQGGEPSSLSTKTNAEDSNVKSRDVSTEKRNEQETLAIKKSSMAGKSVRPPELQVSPAPERSVAADTTSSRSKEVAEAPSKRKFATPSSFLPEKSANPVTLSRTPPARNNNTISSRIAFFEAGKKSKQQQQPIPVLDKEESGAPKLAEEATHEALEKQDEEAVANEPAKIEETAVVVENKEAELNEDAVVVAVNQQLEEVSSQGVEGNAEKAIIDENTMPKITSMLDTGVDMDVAASDEKHSHVVNRSKPRSNSNQNWLDLSSGGTAVVLAVVAVVVTAVIVMRPVGQKR